MAGTASSSSSSRTSWLLSVGCPRPQFMLYCAGIACGGGGGVWWHWLCACNNGSGNRILNNFEHMYCTLCAHSGAPKIMQYFLITHCHKSGTNSAESCSQIVATLMRNKQLAIGSILRVICGRFKSFFVRFTSADQAKLAQFYLRLRLRHRQAAVTGKINWQR